MSGERTPSELLRAAADELEKRIEGTSPGPWFYNGYSGIYSQPMLRLYEDWLDDRPMADHTMKRQGTCPDCNGSCALFTEDYERDPTVLFAAAHHGDTAIGARAADLAYAAAMDPLVGAALVEILRSTADVLDRTGPARTGPALRAARALLGEEQGREGQGPGRIEEGERRG